MFDELDFPYSDLFMSYTQTSFDSIAIPSPISSSSFPDFLNSSHFNSVAHLNAQNSNLSASPTLNTGSNSQNAGLAAPSSLNLVLNSNFSNNSNNGIIHENISSTTPLDPSPDLPNRPLSTSTHLTVTNALLAQPLSTSTHPMLTISKSSIYKPKVYSIVKPICDNHATSSIVREALINPHWKQAMEDEFQALIKNNT